MAAPSPTAAATGLPRVLWVAILISASVLTLVNAFKPLHIDDPFIFRIAEQIVESPLDPYGFDIFWLQWPQPVHEELTPPVLPYWWAIGLALFGMQPVLWKVWLLPFALLLCTSITLLLRRVAPGFELPGLVLFGLSPAVLPSFNLMQDLPALGLGLAALAGYLWSDEHDSWRGALLAGLVAGLATQTKYTAVSILACVVLHGLLRRRWRLPVLTLLPALALFFAWEGFMTALYGHGMFFNQLQHGQFWVPRTGMLVPMLRLLGGTVPLLGVLILATGGLPRGVCLGVAGAILAGFASVLWSASEPTLFNVLALWCAVTATLSVWLNLKDRQRHDWVPLWLVGWLAIELGVYLATAPFPAVRRVLGLAVVLTLLAARAWVRHAQPLRKLRPVLAVAVTATVALGLLYAWVDQRNASAQREAVAAAQAQTSATPGAQVWFVGHWGFQYYAEMAGMKPVVPDRSTLALGDWLVVPSPIDRQDIQLGDQDVRVVSRWAADGAPAVVTGFGFYGGATPLAHRRPRFEIVVLQVLREFVPITDWPIERLADWGLTAGGETAAAAVPALARALEQGGVGDQRLAAKALAQIGPRSGEALDALVQAATSADRTTRYWSVVSLTALEPRPATAHSSLIAALEDPDPEIRELAAQALRPR